MSEDETVERKSGKLRLQPKGTLGLKKTVDAGQVQQKFTRGRTKTVTVEVKKTRAPSREASNQEASGGLSETEKAARLKALQALQSGAARPAAPPAPPPRVRPEPKPKPLAVEQSEAEGLAPGSSADASLDANQAEDKTQLDATAPPPEPELSPEERELLELKRAEEEEREKQAIAQREAAERAQATPPSRRPEGRRSGSPAEGRRPGGPADGRRPGGTAEGRRAGPAPGGRTGQNRPPPRRPGPSEPLIPIDVPLEGRAARDEDRRRERITPEEERRATRRGDRGDARRRTGKLTISQALDDEVAEERTRSLASMRRARERERQQRQQRSTDEGFVVREVVLPEVIVVSELANRMAVRTVDVVKKMMQLGVIATANQLIDADTAELVIGEFGHRIRRVSESDVEIGLDASVDSGADLVGRPPVITIMGHVDHGKTSLLDAIRKTKVTEGEAGGITQHIGAYQVDVNGAKLTFLDTPGHAAFSAMRQRGAKVTDIVVLVVAADDGVQPQTVEAINHAKAAEAPMIVAINKIDKPDADPSIAKQGLLTHEIVAEDFGGDVQMVPVSAITGQGLDDLLEAIALQAELLELKANPVREARGAVIEAQLDRGRGAVATVLVQSGTLRRGDVLVAGAEWGRVRAMLNERGEQVDEAGPSTPVEVLGLSGVPMAGDEVVVVDSDARAREVSEYRQRIERDKRTATAPRGTINEMFGRIASGASKELPVVVKADVQGSLEAIVGSLEKFQNDEVSIRVLHSGVGAISESDVTLASSSGGFLVGFNVRAGASARNQAQQDGVDIRYYSIIYELLDDMKAAVEGLLAPEQREKFIGNAEIREVFNITKVGKVAGCRIIDGIVKRGAGVRLLRDNVVIHQGKLGTLKRFKEEVREVREGFECGMGFENYQDIKEGDVIECFEVEEVARVL
jgi:translation initiation factor IF-2